MSEIVEKSMLYEAFQFGFGHGTNAPDAEVIATLQYVEDSGNAEIVHFKHVKVAGRTEETYCVQDVGIDADFHVSVS